MDLSPVSVPSEEAGGLSIPSHVLDPALVMYPFKGLPDMEKALMTETAAAAMDELIRLVRINEPLWVKSVINEKYVLHHDSYERIFPKSTHLRSPNARVESSKELVVVAMKGMQLVDMLLDPVSFLPSFFHSSCILKLK